MTQHISKKFFLPVMGSLTMISFIVAPTAFAQVTPTPTSAKAGKEAAMTERIDQVKQRADQAIQDRLDKLNALITRINGMKRISADQKTAFVTQIQSNITSLTALKAKIDADTDATALKTDAESIYKDYRIYAVFMPKTALLAHADSVLELAADMDATTAKAQAKIDAAKQAGQDVTALQNSLNDRTARAADARTQANNAISSISNVTPASYPGSNDTLKAAREMLKTANSDLQTAHQDMVSLAQGLKGLKDSKGTKK
jgi:hypothetical protein